MEEFSTAANAAMNNVGSVSESAFAAKAAIVVSKLAAYAPWVGGWIGGILMTIIVITFNPPKSKKETFAAVVSSLVFSLGGACALVLYFGMSIPNNIYGLCFFMSLCFVCAGPGWFIVRLFFAQLEKFKDKDVGQIVTIVKSWFGK